MNKQYVFKTFVHVLGLTSLSALACACVETRVVGQPHIDAGPCNSACTEGTVCDPGTNTCVQCLENDHCVGHPNGILCEPTSHQCVQCVTSTDCTTVEASLCHPESHRCVPCTASADCSHLTNKICDTANPLAHKCVQCTGAERDACNGKVCDANTKTCSTFDPNTADLCRPCVSDLQCMAGQLCAPMKFGDPEQFVGYFCLWQRNATGTGAPGGTCTNARPFAIASVIMTIDNAEAEVCALRTIATCPAYKDFTNSKSCSGETIEGHAQCGLTNLNDGICTMDSGGGGSHQCTLPCGVANDCPSSFACATGRCAI